VARGEPRARRQDVGGRAVLPSKRARRDGRRGTELARQKGLYIFIPLILIQALGNALIAVGAFDTPIPLTRALPRQLASQVSGWICLLSSSTRWNRWSGGARRLSADHLRSSIKTGALLAGKALANALVEARCSWPR
jgi:hypothetical protein